MSGGSGEQALQSAAVAQMGFFHDLPSLVRSGMNDRELLDTPTSLLPKISRANSGAQSSRVSQPRSPPPSAPLGQFEVLPATVTNRSTDSESTSGVTHLRSGRQASARLRRAFTSTPGVTANNNVADVQPFASLELLAVSLVVPSTSLVVELRGGTLAQFAGRWRFAVVDQNDAVDAGQGGWRHRDRIRLSHHGLFFQLGSIQGSFGGVGWSSRRERTTCLARNTQASVAKPLQTCTNRLN